MMGRNHVITGGLSLGWGAAVVIAGGITLGTHPEAFVLAGQLYLWGTTAPDLDAENAVAVSTWSPRNFSAGAKRERLLPEARSVVATLLPGAHWLSAGMRVIARKHYLATRGEGDPIDNDDPHRKLWHTFTGAAVMAAVVCLLLSPVPLVIASKWWPEALTFVTKDGRWWLPWLTAAPWGGFMSGVWVRAYFGERINITKKWKPSSRLVGFLAGFVSVLVCGATGALTASWWLYAIAIVLGCGMHVAGDKCSRHGASWWAPYIQQGDGKRWAPSHLVPRWMRFRTGYGGEALFVLGLIGFSLVAWWVILSAGSALPVAWNLWTVLGG